MKIGLYHKTPDRVVGCRKLTLNLIKGLKELKQEYVENEPGDVNGIIHGAVNEFRNCTLPRNTVVGPELCVLPTEMPDKLHYYRNWVQPSLWVVDYFKTFKEAENTRFYTWPSGIDTDEFNIKRGPYKRDCFIYYKNVTKQTPIEKLEYVKRDLEKKGMTYEVLTYGEYKEETFKELCQTSLFAIFLTGTESQGIAIMEAMAMDIPIYVINETTFEYNGFKYNGGVSSAPYFGEKCGIIADDLSRLGEFRDRIMEFWPRDYIMENHTCKHGAQKYVDILRKCHEK